MLEMTVSVSCGCADLS